MTAKIGYAQAGNDKLRRGATYASASVAVVLIIAKMVAYFMTDSMAMLSSLVDSTVDLMASLVTIYGVASALRPPDHDHRFGHGKAEPLAALGQAAFIAGSSVLLCYEALHRLYHPQSIQNTNLGYSVMAGAIVLSVFLIFFQRYVIRRTASMAIGADNIHYLGDLAVNLAVIAAFGLYQFTGLDWFDPVFALAIALGLIMSAFHIAKEALNILMDRELPDQDRAKIISIVKARPLVRGVHDLRTRSDSDRVFIEFHLELDGTTTLQKAHEVTDDIMGALKKEFPSSDILVHQDPAGLIEDRLDAQIEIRSTHK